MIPHDPALDAALGAVAWRPYVTATFLDPSGVQLPPVAVASPAGTYSTDSSRWPRVECELILPTALTPSMTSSPVSPYGGRLLLDVGVEFAGARRGFRLATLDVTETSINRPDGTITVQAASREARVDEDRFDAPSASPAGTATTLISNIVRQSFGDLAYPVVVRVTTDTTFPAGEFTYEGGAWGVVESIADAAGLEAYFDAAGSLVIADAPVKGTSVLTYRTGDGGSITGYESTRGWAPNRVVINYEDENGSRVQGSWQDTAPTSATRVTGPYGRHTDTTNVTVSAPAKLPSQASADRAAATRAKRVAARYRSVTLRTIPAPWIEPGDTVTVALLGGLTETLLVGSHSFPLDALDVATLAALDDTYTRDLGGTARGREHHAHNR